MIYNRRKARLLWRNKIKSVAVGLLLTGSFIAVFGLVGSMELAGGLIK